MVRNIWHPVIAKSAFCDEAIYFGEKLLKHRQIASPNTKRRYRNDVIVFLALIRIII
jgi:hypothetical protein